MNTVRYRVRKVKTHPSYDSIRMNPELDRGGVTTRMPSLRMTTSDPLLRGKIQAGMFLILSVDIDSNQAPDPVAVQQHAARAAAVLAQDDPREDGDDDDDQGVIDPFDLPETARFKPLT